MKKIVIAFITFFALPIILGAQTTYTSSPSIGSYVSCPGNYTCGSETFFGSVIQMKTNSINGNSVQFSVKKCTGGSLTQGGTLYLKAIDECTSSVADQNYPAGTTYPTVNYTFPANFTSGSRKYYCIIDSNNGDGTTTKYRGGYVTITASTISPEINITSPSGSVYDKGCNMNIQWTSQGIGNSVSVELVNTNNSTIAVIADPTNNDGSLSWLVGTNENGQYPTNIPAGNYKIKIYETGTGNGLDYSSTFSISAPSLTVTSPNGGENYSIGSSLPITWNSNNFCGDVSIELVNSSNSLVKVIADPTNNDGNLSWPINNVSAGTYKIKIYKVVSSGTSPAIDFSNSTFTISEPTPNINITSPSSNNYDKGCNMTIQWNSENIGNSVSVELVNTSNSTVVIIADPTNNDGSLSWVVGTNENGQYPINIPAGNYKIKIYETGTGNGLDYSSTFQITDPNITIVSPNGGENYSLGSSLPISWSSDNFCGDVSIELVNTSNTLIEVIADPSTNDGSENWVISGIPTGSYKIKIYKTVSSGLSPVLDYSNNTFMVSDPSPQIDITNPSGGSYDKGCNMDIQWTTGNVGSNVSLELVNAANSATVAVIVDPTPNDSGFNWIVGTDASGDYPTNIPPGSYKIKIYETGTGNGEAYSSSFSIAEPIISVSSPNGGESFNLGENLHISWSFSNFCGNISIELLNISTNNTTLIVDDIVNNGAYSWGISGVSTGNYKVKIYKTVPNSPSPVVDFSDNSFSINDTGTPILQLNQAMAISPPSPITGEDAFMQAVVVNNGTASWTGLLAFQLINISEGTSTDMINPISVTLNEGETQTLIRPNGPIGSLPGNYQIRVQYQTTGTNTWTTVDEASFSNPLDFTIQDAGAPSLELSSPITVTPNPLTQYAPGSFNADLINSGGSSWSGNLAMHIVVNGQEIDLDRDDNITITSGNLYTQLEYSTASVMTDPGVYDIWVVHQSDGIGNWEPVGAGNFQNPISITINDTQGGITLTSPNGGETFEVGQLLPVSWTTSGTVGNISIELESYPQNDEDEFIIADGIPNTGSYNNYTIPVCAVGNYRVKIYETGNGAVNDFSDAAFSITIDPVQYSISLTAPNGGQNFNAGDPYPQISWSSNGNIGNISIELINDQGIQKDILADGIVNSSPFNTSPDDQWNDNFPVNIPQGEYKFKIYNTGCGTVNDVSDATFTINSTYSGDCSCTINNPSPAQTEVYSAVTYLCENCIIDDPVAPENDLHPLDPIIKEDLAKITFLAMFGDPTTVTYADNFPTPFFDMQETSSYQRYGKVLSYLEYGDGISPFNRRFANYKPGDYVTRGQVCKVYCEAFNITCDATFVPFTDVAQSHPEFKYIAELAERGILNSNNPLFNPDLDATRQDAFIILWRILTACGDCMEDALIAAQAATGQIAKEAFFDPGNYTPDNLSRHPGFSDANFDSYSATGFFMGDRGMPLVFGHSYNSYLTELPDELFPQRPLGNGWVHTYNSYITKVPGWNNTIGNQQDILVVVWSDGSMHTYEDNSNLTKITKGNYDVITYNSGSDSYTIKKKNQVEFTFENIPNANDAPYMLTQIKDRNDNVINLNYQLHNFEGKSLARLTQVVGTTNRVLNFSYYGNSDKLHTVTDASLNRTIEFYLGDPNNLDTRLLWYKDAENKLTNYNYDPSEGGYYLLNKITLPNGNFISNNYNDKKLISSITNDATTNNTVQTDVNWGLNGATPGTTSTVQVTDGQSVRDYTYTTDANGKTTDIVAPTNDADIIYGDAQNPTLPTSITVAGLTTTYEYDAMGNVTDVHQELNVDHHFEYNNKNDITLYRNPRFKETTFDYGDGKNLTQVNAPIGSTQITYYPYGLVHTVTNPENIVVSYEYDNHGNVEKMTAPEGIETNAVYDLGSRLKDFFNPNNQKTSYGYDNRNFVRDVTHYLPNNSDYQEVNTHYDYDGNGNLTDITNAHGKVTHMNYDYFDLLEDETFGSATRQYEYDIEGKLRKITKADGTELIYSYFQTKGLLQSDGYATYTYDAKHRLGSVTKNGKAITFNYDNLNRITSTIYDGKTVQYEYDDNSNVTKIIYPEGQAADYGYDDNDRMKTVKWNNALMAEYFYLLDGRLDHADLANGVTTKYFYDDAGRVDSVATVKGTDIIAAYGFNLDKLGNHKVENKMEPFDYSNRASINEDDYTYNLNRNEILTGGGKNFTHDNNGNMKTVAGARSLTYTWDAHDMLTSVSGDFSATYVYDGLGNRRAATRNGATTKYVLDILGMSRILMDLDASGNAQNYYLYGLGMIGRIKPNGDTRYYHYDFRGSTVAMTDEAGTITHQYAYDEYGETLQLQEEDHNPFQYVGGFGVMQENDHLLFMRARFYDVEIGRFLSEDPIWSDNLYAYVGGNPVTRFDFLGEDWMDVINQWIRTGGKSKTLNAIEGLDNIILVINISENISEGDYYNAGKNIVSNSGSGIGFLYGAKAGAAIGIQVCPALVHPLAVSSCMLGTTVLGALGGGEFAEAVTEEVYDFAMPYAQQAVSYIGEQIEKGIDKIDKKLMSRFNGPFSTWDRNFVWEFDNYIRSR